MSFRLPFALLVFGAATLRLYVHELQQRISFLNARGHVLYGTVRLRSRGWGGGGLQMTVGPVRGCPWSAILLSWPVALWAGGTLASLGLVFASRWEYGSESGLCRASVR